MCIIDSVNTLLRKVIMSRYRYMFVSVSYMKQGGFKTEEISVPEVERIFIRISESATGVSADTDFRLRGTTADSRSFAFRMSENLNLNQYIQ